MGVAQTSIDTYYDIEPDLPLRRELVQDELLAYYRVHDEHPTAYELLEFMNFRRPSWLPAFDLNGVRPRLTELKQQGAVRVHGKRACGITGRTAYVWEVV